MTRKPAISVIIPTYNWSAVLRLAIRSVLLQTEQDFEILVVGDGCTDDSEAVVASFADARIRWHNLDRNHGSQWAANNWALENVRADWVAYLGHDDIWYPTHLAAMLRAAKAEAADVVTSIMILYWPPVARGRSLAGMFPSGRFGPGDFVPPSAVAHKTSLYGEAIRWRDPETLVLPMDAAFLDELAAERHVFASTHELTCFKFNAAFRRDAYKLKPVAEQEAMLARIESGVDFRQDELIDTLQTVVSGRFAKLGGPLPEGTEKGSIVRRNRRYKGVEPRFDPASLRRIEQRTRFDVGDQDMLLEWHTLETDAKHGSFRWTGPSPRATIDLPVLFDRDLSIRIRILHTLRPDLIDAIGLSLHEHPLAVTVRREDAVIFLEAPLRRADVPDTGRDFGITIDAGEVARPYDLSGDPDRRWLGLAVNWIELAPLTD